MVPLAFGVFGYVYSIPFIAGFFLITSQLFKMGSFDWTLVLTLAILPGFVLWVRAWDSW